MRYLDINRIRDKLLEKEDVPVGLAKSKDAQALL